MSAPYKASPDHFLFGPVLGEGAFAKVFECVHTVTGNKFAVKTVDKNFIKKNNKVDTVIRERNVLQTLNGHPGIIKLYFTFQDPFNLYYALELAPNGEMFDQLQHYKTFDTDKTREYAIQLFEIIRYMHSKNIVHRDIKPSNILLSETGHLKLADFGTAKQVDPVESQNALEALLNSPSPYTNENDAGHIGATEGKTDTEFEDNKLPERKKRNSFVGTAQYVPPELLCDRPVTFSTDWWSFGILLHEMLLGHVPFKGDSDYLTFQAILSHDLVFPDNFDPDAKDLITKLLDRDVHKRLGVEPSSVEEIAEHPFFKGVNFNVSPQALFDRPAPEFYTLPGNATGDDDAEEDIEAQNLAKKHPTDLNNVPKGDDVAHVSSSQPNDIYNFEFTTSSASSFKTSQYYPHLPPDEHIVFAGVVNKSGKWGPKLFRKTRMLLLTSVPRILYIDNDKSVVRGDISLTPGTKAEVRSQKSFDIITENRTFNIICEDAPYISKSELTALEQNTAPERKFENPTDRLKEPFYISKNIEWAVDWVRAIQRAIDRTTAKN